MERSDGSGILRSVNPSGNPQSLAPAPQGNAHAVKHGLHSPRVLAPRAETIANALMELPHVATMDLVAAQEIGSLVARLEAVDRDLDERGHFGRSGARSLLDHRARLSRELRAWLDHFGATPKSRAAFAQRLATGSLADEIQRRLSEVQGE